MSAFFLWFALAFTNKLNWLRSPSGYIALFTPSLISIAGQLLYNSILYIDPQMPVSFGWLTRLRINPWTIFYYIHSYLFFLTGLGLFIHYQAKGAGKIRRKQARIISLTSLAAILVNATITGLSHWRGGPLPNVLDLSLLVWSAGIFYAMIRFRLFRITASAAAENVLETIHDGVLLADIEAVVQHANGAISSILGRTRESILGLPIGELLNISPKEQKIALTKTYQESFCITPSGQKRPVLVSSSILKDENGIKQGNVYVIRDISENRLLEKKVVEAEQRERQRLSRELHDGLGQLLTGLSLQCKSLQNRIKSSKPVPQQQLSSVEELIGKAIDTTRMLAKGLSPVPPGADGLESSLNELAADCTKTFSIPCGFETAGPVRVNKSLVASHIFRIAQEAVINAVKHADAGRISIRLGRSSGQLRLVVSDDGKGIDGVELGNRGMGLEIMAYRARVIGAQLHIGRNEKGGTDITCTLSELESMYDENPINAKV
jgi:PAS domain S-box-containing protein